MYQLQQIGSECKSHRANPPMQIEQPIFAVKPMTNRDLATASLVHHVEPSCCAQPHPIVLVEPLSLETKFST